MTNTTTTRRERLRMAAATEIKESARRLLAEGGLPALTLRAIGRDMGMTAPAIYRYFPSIDALVDALTEDLFDELVTEVDAAREGAGSDPVARMAGMAQAFRHWGVTHTAEFALMFGPRVPGVTVMWSERQAAAEDGSARFGAAFLEEFANIAADAPLNTLPEEVLRDHLAPQLQPFRANHGDQPLPVVFVCLSAWTRLYGLVAMEVFGHIRWAVDDAQALFDLELLDFARQLSAGPASSALPNLNQNTDTVAERG